MDKRLIRNSLNLFFALFFFQQPLTCAPKNYQIISGNIDVQYTENKLQIYGDDDTIVYWDSFDIEENDDIQIYLPSASSSIQFYVKQEKSIEIAGTLYANGKLSLFTSYGVNIQEEGKLQCSALIIDTLNVPKEDLARSIPKITNRGTIIAESQLKLSSWLIKNEGFLISNHDEVLLQSTSDISEAAWQDERRIQNKGIIYAKSIHIATHSDSFSNEPAIHNLGELISFENSKEHSSIFIDAINGTFLNQNEISSNGGKIVLLGKQIVLDEGAIVDASGDFDGGDIFIGGGKRGSNPSIPNADKVFVHRNAQIQSNARFKGNGGDIVVWADKSNTFLGSISANSAENEGKGGNAEVSSKESLYFDGKVSLLSSIGPQGLLLIDPDSITIQASSPNINGTPGTDITTTNELSSAATYPGINSIITAGAVNSLLTGAVNMQLSAVNFITVNSPVTASGVVTSLILNAPTTNLNQPISFPFGGSLSGTATVVNVGPSGSIQNGIDAVAVGGTVNIATATYVEEILITKNLTLNGNGSANSSIVCPTTPTPLTNTFIYTVNGGTYHPFVMVQGPTNVIIQNLTVDGNSQPTNFLSNRFLGIGYHNAGGTIQNVHATNVEDSFPGGGTQHGEAIFIAIDNGMPYAITIQNCLVDRFQKSGINVRGSTLTANILNNTVTGEMPPSNATANGVLSRDGAKSLIQGNTINDVQAAAVGADSVGLFLIGTGCVEKFLSFLPS